MANQSGENLLYFLIGGFVGASVALLFAPKSGEETRQFLETKYREGAGKVGHGVETGKSAVDEKIHQGREYVADLLNKGRGSVTRQKDQLNAALEAGKRAYHEEKEKLEEPEPPRKEPTFPPEQPS